MRKVIEPKRDLGVDSLGLFMLLTNPKDKETLQNGIKELSNSMTRVDSERDLQKDIVDKVADEVGVEKKFIKKLAAIYHKQAFTQVQSEQEQLESLYEELFS
jgi:division protein CdvB (Snf7/Vps24/ESCRT-III family)